MLENTLEIVSFLGKLSFSFGLSMLFGGFILGIFFTFSKKQEEIFINIMKYAFVSSILLFIIEMTLSSVVK